MINKIIYKIKSLFRKKIYVVLDGILLNATYTNRYFKNQENEGKKILEFLKARNIEVKTMVDLGANFAEISLYFSKYAPGIKIFAIEPSSKNIKVIADNLKRQNFNTDNIKVIRRAVSDRPGKVSITKMMGEKNTIVNLRGRKEKVRADTLASIVSEFKIESIDFLKIDIEGAEYLLFESLREILPRIKTILIEINGDERNIALIKLLFSRGEIYLRSGEKWTGTVGELIDYFKKEQNDIWFINFSAKL